MPLLLVLLGGMISIVSSLCAGIFTSFLKRRGDRLDKRREMLQLLVIVAHEISSMPYEYERPDGVYAWRKDLLDRSRNLSTVVSLYLPELRQVALELVEAGKKCIISFADFEMAVREGLPNDELRASRSQRINELGNAWKHLMEEAEILAVELRMNHGVKAQLDDPRERLLFNEDQARVR